MAVTVGVRRPVGAGGLAVVAVAAMKGRIHDALG